MAMRSAQSLYEAGYITYMRTDSTTLSETALTAARAEIAERYGAPVPARRAPPLRQEGQERPGGARGHPPGRRHASARPSRSPARSSRADAEVYELIWKRTIASQMTDATGETVTVRLGAANPAGRLVAATWSSRPAARSSPTRASASPTSVDRDEGDDADEQERQLPPMAEGDALDVRSIEPKGHETQPPARFTEASLVKRLEELGVGRPSTYASTIKTIQDREYVWKKGTALVPSFKAFAVVNLLEQHFPDLVDYAFTARMEDDLDEIAGGDRGARARGWPTSTSGRPTTTASAAAG